MKHLFWTTYDIAIRIFGLSIRVLAIWSRKSSTRLKGLENWKTNLGHFTSPILFHVASLGEFEQARPVIERIKQINPDKQLILSFFSPSGYEIRKNYKNVDQVMYLPMDTAKNMRFLISQMRPSAVIFTKYDLWFNLIQEAHKNNVPCYLISSIFRSHQIYFKWFTTPLSDCLKAFAKIFTQDHGSVEVLNQLGFDNVIHAGDTRVDRVIEIQQQSFDSKKVVRFVQGRKAFIIGSSWPNDEEIIFPMIRTILNNGWCIILAPHETHVKRVNQLCDSLDYKTILYSELTNESNGVYEMLIVDTIGDLSHLYTCADIAYIGGGFDQGIHNTLEPAAAGLPILFGPKYHKFEEAHAMIDRKLAISVSNSKEFKEALNYYMDESIYNSTRNVLETMIHQRAGATKTIIDILTLDNIL